MQASIIKSVSVGPRRELTTPKQRKPLEEGGPTDFQLMRQAEKMGESLYSSIASRKVVMTGGNNGQAGATSLSLLHYHDKITNPQYHAGLAYQGMRRMLFGQAAPKGSQLSKIIATSIFATLQMRDAQSKMDSQTDEDRDEYYLEVQTLYARGDGRLRRAWPYYMRVREITRRVLIDDMMPINSKPNVLERLRMGLQELNDVWK